MSNKDTNKHKAQKIQDMKKILYRNLFIDTQFNEVINFYGHNHSLSTIEKENAEKLLQQIDKKADPKQYNEVNSRLAFYSRYPWYLRENIFLMLFSLIEELLSSAYEFCWEQDLNSDGSGIKRFKTPYRNINIDLTSITRWEFLTTSQKIRNAMLHANGNIDLYSNSDEIYAILNDNKWSNFFGKRPQGFIKITSGGKNKSEYIEIKDTGIKELLHAFYDLEELLFKPNNA